MNHTGQEAKATAAPHPNQPVLVLMYHAVPARALADGHADAHYSVDCESFRRQLDLIDAQGLRLASVRELCSGASASLAPRPAVALTFDDGHESNFAAFAEIARRGGSADLFINPSTVGTPGYLSWAQLRELAAHGASIQSHGQHHVFLDDLPPQRVLLELEDSRARIADELGAPAELFAPPNGRMPTGFIPMALAAGYRAVCSSRFGVWGQRDAREIPRVAVLAGTRESQFQAWIRQSPVSMASGHARALALSTAKRALGNGAYRRVRQWLLREPAEELA